MSVPVIDVNLIYPPSPTVLNLAPYLTQDTALDITNSFEAPGQSGTITAGNVSIKGLDTRTGMIRAILSTIQPSSTDFSVQIWRDGVKRFDGYVLPNTVQFNAQEFSFSFSAVSIAAILATVQADDATRPALAALQRSMAGWTVTNTILGVTATDPALNTPPQITISGPGLCPLVIGDQLSLVNMGKPETVTVSNVTFDGTIWTVVLESLGTNYPAGTPITLATPFLHSVEIRTAVDALLRGAGLQATTDPHFNAAFFSLGSLFASPDATVEMIGGVRVPLAPPLGIALAGPRGTAGGARLLTYTQGGQYRQDTPPTSVWTNLGGNPGGTRPIDWSRYGGAKTYVLSGPRYTFEALPAGSGTGQSVQYTYYAYDYTSDSFSAPARRYYLRFNVDNYNHGPYDGSAGIEMDFGYETTLDGHTWDVGASLLSRPYYVGYGVYNYLPIGCGIDIDVGNGVVYFTDLVPFALVPSGYRTDRYVSSFKIATATVNQKIIPRENSGAPHCYRTQRLGVFTGPPNANGGDISAPNTVSVYYPTADGTSPSYAQTEAVPADFQPFSIVVDWGADPGGDVLRALSSSTTDGTSLLSFNAQLHPLTQSSILLLAPGSANGHAEMLALQAVSGAWPLIAIIGNKIWSISSTYSGIIEYLDLAGKSCGQVLSDLATLVNGWCYVDDSGFPWFRTRNLPSGLLVGADAAASRIDDAGCLSLQEAPILFGSYMFVRVENSVDSNTYGDAGDAGFASGPLSLNLSNPFVPSASFAAALAGMTYGYLGRRLTGFTVLHQDDGRTYEPGAECWGFLGGQLRHFQITSVTRSLLSNTAQGQGMEL